MGEVQTSQPFPLTAEDVAVLKQTDEEYTLLSWEFIKDVIGTSYGILLAERN
jgi:hypothetical protein